MDAPLRLGDFGPAVIELRELLVLYYPKNFEPSTTNLYEFDSSLDYAVRAFQQSRGLLVDGIVGLTTYKALREAQYSLGIRILYYDPHKPISGDDVSNLQAKLHNLGYYHHHIDGFFGSDTLQALTAYQREFGLVADGVCGPATIRSLQFLGLDIGGGSAYAIREVEKARDLGPYLTGKRIFLDPGGGERNLNEIVMTDEGPMSYSDLLWDISLRTAKQLSLLDVTVLFSRNENDSLTDSQRAQKANNSRCNLNISLRLAKYPNDKAHGVSSFYYGNSYNSFSPIGKQLAIYLQKEIVARTPLLDCRYHEKTWDILRLTSMPSVQVDLGYMTNSTDAHIIGTTSYRQSIAEGIVVAVKRLYLLGQNDQPTGSYTLSELIADENSALAKHNFFK